eukprot:6174129-Pleurochrysis_carterae.AAC.1
MREPTRLQLRARVWPHASECLAWEAWRNLKSRPEWTSGRTRARRHQREASHVRSHERANAGACACVPVGAHPFELGCTWLSARTCSREIALSQRAKSQRAHPSTALARARVRNRALAFS